MKSSTLGVRALAPWLLWFLLVWSAPHQAWAFNADTASDEIFANAFEPAGYAIPLASPDQPDYLYTAPVTIGDQDFALSIDTASSSLGVAGIDCTSGCTGISPLYTPSLSASPTGNTASTMFADGTGWSGPVYSDTVGLGNGSPLVSLDLVEITQATSFFDANNGYQGILGLGPQELVEPNTTGYIPVVMGAGLANIFAFELCDNIGANAGTMWLGGDGDASLAQYTPLVPIDYNNNPFYAINVNALSLGSTSIVTNAASIFQEPIIDTGTSLFYVPRSVYTKFKQTLGASAEFKSVFGSNTFSTRGGCVTDASVTDAQVESGLPSIMFSLPNVTNGQPDVTIQASALDTYLYNAGGGKYCLAIQDGGSFSVFGDAFMQAFHIVIDLKGDRVGFAPPTSCTAPANRRIRHPTQNGPHSLPRPGRP